MSISRIPDTTTVAFSVDSDEKIAKKKKIQKDEVPVESVTTKNNSVKQLLSQKKAPQLINVEVIKQQISKGNYQIDVEKVAASIMDLDKLWY